MMTALGAAKIAAGRRGMSLADYLERITTEKWCGGCKSWHDRAAFAKDASRADGLSTRCRNNPQTQAWAAKNRERINAEHRRCYRENPQRRATALRSWNRRRARKAAADGDGFTREDEAWLYFMQGGACAYCTNPLPDNYHRDHCTPLVRGGKHDESNMALACPSCNTSKGTKTAEEFQKWREAKALDSIC